jgi:HEAT repeat protein
MAPYLRLEAARLLAFDFSQEKPACVNALLEFARKGKPDAKAQALWLVPFFRHLSAEDSAGVLQAVIGALADPDTHVRHAAGHVLIGIANSSAIPYLEKALAGEKDEYVRLQLQSALQKLKEKPAAQ